MHIFQFLVLLISGAYIIYKDLKERIIPNNVILILLVFGVLITVLDYDNVLSHLLGFLVSGGIFLIIAVVTRAFGMGDVKYMFVVGLILGLLVSMYAIMFSFAIGGIVNGILLVSKKVKKTDYVAFGPYLVVGSLLALIYSKL